MSEFWGWEKNGICPQDATYQQAWTERENGSAEAMPVNKMIAGMKT